MPSPSFIPPSLAVPHLQDDHLRPLHHAPRGWARLVDHDVWGVWEEPALRPLHEGAVSANGAGLQEPVECLLVLSPGPRSVSEFLWMQEFKRRHPKQGSSELYQNAYCHITQWVSAVRVTAWLEKTCTVALDIKKCYICIIFPHLLFACTSWTSVSAEKQMQVHTDYSFSLSPIHSVVNLSLSYTHSHCECCTLFAFICLPQRELWMRQSLPVSNCLLLLLQSHVKPLLIVHIWIGSKAFYWT